LLVLYIDPLFHIFEKRTKNISISILVSVLLFVNNGLFISKEICYEKSNISLFYSYNIIFFLFSQFSLVIEHNKSEVFHFSKSMKIINPPSLDLTFLKSLLLRPKDMWWYLGFFLTRNYLFDITYDITLTKSFLQSKTWKYWTIYQENSLQYTNISYIEHVFSLSPYIVFSSGISKEHYYTNLLRNWRKYREKQLYG